jgi:nitroimidazol reductase NimA-like FMN-containing flavoprotein (pyridoxamine 5'-phosphate oxidase superfamily)
MSEPGDLGRRIAERRQELELSREAVAELAGMDPSFLEFVETSPYAELTRSALLRLSAVLWTTAGSLTGGGILGPPGPSNPSSALVLEALDPEMCATLISSGGIGRVIFPEPRGPVALPVNFRVLDGAVIFRTGASASLIQAVHSASDGHLSFEVDHIDDALTEGWSVLITGDAQVISDPDERDLAEATGVTPWAGGTRDVYIRITPNQITGRRIRRLESRHCLYQ